MSWVIWHPKEVGITCLFHVGLLQSLQGEDISVHIDGTLADHGREETGTMTFPVTPRYVYNFFPQSDPLWWPGNYSSLGDTPVPDEGTFTFNLLYNVAASETQLNFPFIVL